MFYRMWVSALALTSGFVGAASAQEADVATSDEIIVTAQLREQRLIDVPMAVTALNQETLDQLGITKYDELALFVPGFEVQEQSANNTGFVIRGITSDSGEATTEPRVAVYQDGVSTSRNRGAYMELFDIERVEVARGPQATLYGRGALIGAVNVIQNKADTSDPYFGVELGGGEDGYLRSLVVLNAPLVTDTLGVRVAGTLRARDGYVENLADGEELGGVDVAAARVALAFEPSNTLRFDLIGNIHSDSNSGTPFKSGTYAPVGGDLSPYSPAALSTFGGFEGGAPLGLKREVRSLTLLGNWEITPALTLTSITGSREFESKEIFDPDGSPMPLIVAAEDAEGEQFSQEFRVLWDNGGPVSGFAGLSYFHEEGSQRAPTQYNEQYMLAFATGQLPGPDIPTQAEVEALGVGFLTPFLGATGAQNFFDGLNTEHREYFTNFGETTSYDVFADLTWRVTDRFELTGGARYTTDDKKSALDANYETPSSLANLVALLQGEPFGSYGLFTQPGSLSASDTFDAVTWRLLGRYELSDDWAAWASYARGRRPEVIDVSPGNLPGAEASASILPAKLVDSIEVGTRGQDFFSGALDVEASVYYYKYTDFQTTEFDGLSLVTVNAGEASAYGVETALTWRPFEHLSLFGAYSYNHARFDEGAREGNSFRLSPDHSASLVINYEIPVGVGLVYFRPSYTWQSKIFFDDNNDRTGPQFQPSPLPPFLPPDSVVDEFQDAYGLLNLRAGFEHESGHWSLEAFVNNALDEEYLIDAGNTGDAFTIPTFIRGAPRLVGVELTARF